MATPAPINNLLREAWIDVSDLANYPEFIALVVALVVALLISRTARSSGAVQSLGNFGAGGVRRLVFPLLALLFVWLGIVVLKQWFEVDLLRLALPLLGSLAMVRAVVYLLRQVLAAGSLLASFERSIAALVWVGFALHIFGVLPDAVDLLEEISFHIGKQKLNLWLVLQGLFWIGITLLVALWAGRLAEERLLKADGLDANLRVAFARLVNALLVVIGVLVTLPLVGIDLTVLSVFGGALGVGLGFGLQKIASNYMSGFIILVERSIRHGDMITADNFYGEVRAITTRSVIVKALDGREAIIPNETFITQTVLNHSFSNREVRVALPVQVSYASDLDKVMALMTAVALANPRVLKDPPPAAYVVRFADNGIDLELGFWIGDPESGQMNVRSELNLAIWRGFRDAGIEIPFPQHEVRLVGTPETQAKPI
jgi:small-conductance mechanosensitive channel